VGATQKTGGQSKEGETPQGGGGKPTEGDDGPKDDEPGPPAGQGAEETIDTVIEGETSEKIIALIRIIDPALKYLGFSPRYTRKTLLSKSDNIKVSARDLILCFAGYAHIANNVTKLNSKRVDVGISQKVMKAITSMGVVKRAIRKDHLTLPRLAIAFMPEYLIFRKFLTNDLQDQTEAAIDTKLKDLAFYGCDAIRNIVGYTDFHKEFSALIYKPGTEISLDDKSFLTNYNRWNKVQSKGYSKDTQIHGIMEAALSLKDLSRMDALKQIETNLIFYKFNP
jgi:hypothetical protein